MHVLTVCQACACDPRSVKDVACVLLIQHFAIDVIVNSLHPTFHKHNHGESRFVNRSFSGSGGQDLLH